MTMHDRNPNFSPQIWPKHWKTIKKQNSLYFEFLDWARKGQTRLGDLRHPNAESDDYGVLTTLRHNLFTARIPFIFLTAKTDVAERFYGRKLGADDYLTKHCTVKDLVRRSQEFAN